MLAGGARVARLSGMRSLRKLVGICLVCVLPAAPAIARMAESGVLVGVAFLDTSAEGDYGGVRADETARLRLVEARLGNLKRAIGLIEAWRDKSPGEAQRRQAAVILQELAQRLH